MQKNKSKQDGILDLINNHFTGPDGNRTMITYPLLCCMEVLGASHVCIHDNDELIGFVTSIPFTISNSSDSNNSNNSNNDSSNKRVNNVTDIKRYGCTTLLCVHTEHRKKGVASKLLGRLANIGEERGIPNSYHIVNRPQDDTSVRISSWFRPIRLNRCREYGFKFPSYRRPGDRGSTRDELAYRVSLPQGYDISKSNVTDCDMMLTNIIASKFKFKYQPTVEEWRIWTSLIPTYNVTFKGDYVGIFSIYSTQSMNKDSKTVKVAVLCYSNINAKVDGNSAHLLKAAIYTASTEHDLLFGYTLGGITSWNSKDAHVIPNLNPQYFCIRGNKLDLREDDICVPTV